MILRLAISFYLLHGASAELDGPVGTVDVLGGILQIGAGLMLLLGLWTPIAGTLAALLEALKLFRPLPPSWEVILATTMAFSLAFLGPGSYSMDARKYGRKRISIDDR